MLEDTIVLYRSQSLDPDGKVRLNRIVKVYFSNKGKLVISGCDIGTFVEGHIGDSDYEYWIIVQEDELNKVSLLLHVPETDLLPGILNKLKENFGDKSECFELIRGFFDEYGIKYEFGTWR